ncbi:MAG TPA: DUF3800 domain-containing protein [Candidatus Saccharimonadales bacterium]|nr:DUF3800 domain-containing protein [Candidatus Saccharimonadales bacterium]
MGNLYVFIDESGNFDFSRGGTRHFVLSAVTALDPLVSSQKLQALKYRMLAEGIDINCFHASPDLQVVRNAVFDEIERLTNIRINYIYADKRKTHLSYQSPEAFYALFGKTLLKYVFNGWTAAQYQQIIVIFDKALTIKQQKAFLSVVKPELKALSKPYKIYFHPTVADFNSQIADYTAWARYVELERKESRPMDKLKRIPATDFDIFNRGKIHYY